MNKIYFATSNKDKLAEAKEILSNFELESVDLKIDEVQSLDSVEVATKKARLYYQELKQPLFVDDNALIFNALNKLPGPYIGDFLKSLDLDSLLNLIKNNSDRSAIAKVVIVYIDENAKEHVFIGEANGRIAKEPRGENGFGWDSIFIPDGYEKTYAEMTNEEKNSCSMRRLALDKLNELLNSQK